MINNEVDIVYNRVEELRYLTTDRFKDRQKQNAPKFGNINLVGVKSYTYDGNNYPTRDINTQTYIAYNIPYVYRPDLASMYIDSLTNLVMNGAITPFILFLQGRFIKWSDITVVKDYQYSYLVIHDIKNYTVYDDNITIELPCYVRYAENSIIKDYNSYMRFDSDGKLTDDNTNLKGIVEIIDKDIAAKTIYLSENNSYFFIDEDYIIEKTNMLLFKNGKPYKEGLNKLEDKGLNVYRYTDIDELISNNILIKLFYYKEQDRDKSFIYSLEKAEIVTDILKEIETGETAPYLDKAKTNFNFTHSKDKKYMDNINNSINYIMKYNSGLFNESYKKISNIKTAIYSGQEILDMCDDNNTFHLFRRNEDYQYDTYVIMFHNGKLFKYYNTIEYNTNMLSIKIYNEIKPLDTIEFLFFGKVTNRSIPININKGDTLYTNDLFNLDEINIYSETIEDPSYNIYNDNHSIQYKVPFHYNIVDDKCEFIFENEWFYGKDLSVVSDRQFHYCYNIIDTDRLDITLSPDFKYCHNLERYMIFINGQKLNPDQYVFTTMEKDLPFDDLSIYTEIIMHKGDIIEAFYLPENFNNIVISTDIPTTGTIELNMESLKYNFSKDLYFIFINGIKLSPENINDVGRNKIKIINDIGSVKNLCIIEHIDEIKLLSDIFINSSDTWTDFINSLTEEEYKRLVKSTGLTNSIPDMNENQTTRQAVVYEILNNFYRTERFSTNSSFLYAYTNEIIDESEYDDYGNYIIRINDANLENKAAIYNTTENEVDDYPSYNRDLEKEVNDGRSN